MIIHNIEQRTDEWHLIRKGKVTGTGLKRIVGSKTTRQNYMYELIAEKLSIGVPDDESAMARGIRLEDEARKRYEEYIGKKVTVFGFLQSDENEDVGASPDGYIDKKKLDHACEIKCLSGANHVRAFLENKVPEEYYPQGIQAFIVNKELKQLDFVFYDPRMPDLDFFVIEIKRKDVEEDIDAYQNAEFDFIKEVNEIVADIVTKRSNF